MPKGENARKGKQGFQQTGRGKKPPAPTPTAVEFSEYLKKLPERYNRLNKYVAPNDSFSEDYYSNLYEILVRKGVEEKLPEESELQKHFIKVGVLLLERLKTDKHILRGFFEETRVRPLGSGYTLSALVLREMATTHKGRLLLEEYEEEIQKSSDSFWVQDKVAEMFSGARQAGIELQKKRDSMIGKQRAVANQNVPVGEKGIGPLKENLTDKSDLRRSLAYKCPEVAKEWDYELNVDEDGNPVRPEYVTAQANRIAHFICAKCGYRYRMEIKKRTVAYFKNRIACRQCRGLKDVDETRSAIRKILSLSGGTVESLDSLPRGSRIAIAESFGLISKSKKYDEDTINSIAMMWVRGEDLQEILETGDPTILVNKLRKQDEEFEELGKNSVDAVKGFSLEDLSEFDKGEDVGVKEDSLENIFNSAGFAAILPRESVPEHFRLLSERLWKHVYDAEADNFDSPDPDARRNALNNITQQIKSLAQQDVESQKYRKHLLQTFANEYNQTLKTPIPEGYSSRRVTPTGHEWVLRPSLFQRKFAMEVEKSKNTPNGGGYMNWSGTGTGKTLAAILATRQVDAKETLLMCPASLVEQWKKEINAAYPEVEVCVIKSSATMTPLSENDKPRIWILNYDKLSGTDPADDSVAQTSARAAKQKDEDMKLVLRRFAGKVDAVVLDEVHQVKQRYVGSASQRKGQLTEFLKRERVSCRKRGKNLSVVAMTATPVVNNMTEAYNLVEMVTGKKPKFSMEHTLSNADAANKQMMQIGVRWTRKYPVELNRIQDKSVDLSEHSEAISAEIERLGRGGPIHPSHVERTLIKYKLPRITEIVKERLPSSPTIIYTEFVEGVSAPVAEHLRKEGLNVGVYTGSQSITERESVLNKFRSGELDALVASGPIATGVDGLQDACNNIVVASAPWTSAQDEQLTGRLLRTGQQESVTVTYLQTHIDTDSGIRWSWDKNRLSIIEMKRGLAEHVMDGRAAQVDTSDSAATKESLLRSLQDLKENDPK